MRKNLNLILIGVVMSMALPSYATLYSNDFDGVALPDPTQGNVSVLGSTIESNKYDSSWWYTQISPGLVALDPLDSGNKVVEMSNGGLGGKTTLNLSG